MQTNRQGSTASTLIHFKWAAISRWAFKKESEKRALVCLSFCKHFILRIVSIYKYIYIYTGTFRVSLCAGGRICGSRFMWDVRGSSETRPPIFSADSAPLCSQWFLKPFTHQSWQTGGNQQGADYCVSSSFEVLLSDSWTLPGWNWENSRQEGKKEI